MIDPRSSTEDPVDARYWSRVLTWYRAPDPERSVLDLIVTLAPFFAIWAVAWCVLSYRIALAVVLFILFRTMLLAASTGMWFFYVQHQFEHTSWNSEADWSIQNAALEGRSHYDLPPILRWITGNIGIHHIHHLASRIPFYRLPEVLRDHCALVNSNRVALRESLRCARLALWEESERRLVTFAKAHRLPA